MNTDNNITVATKVASSLNSSLDSVSHDFLVALYKQFPFLAYSIAGITYGQIVVALLLFLFIIFLRPIFVNTIISLALKVTSKTETKYDDRVVQNLRKPLRFTFLILGIYIFLSTLLISNKTLDLILGSMLILNLFWIIWSVVDGVQGAIYHAISKLSPDLTTSLGGFILKILKILIWVLALSSVLSLWGINVTALIASLGLGGLAFALAAKDTAANLFGSIAILMDKSIKIGDWIKVDGVEGIVEDIGMRTTKVRTFYKSLVVVPNQIVANSHIENFSRRDKRRIKMRVGLTYDTTIEQVEKIVADIKDMLQKHPNIAQDETMLVNFDNFGDSAKEIFIYTFTNSAVWQEYLDIKEDVQYKIENIVKAHNSSFAFPSQSLYIESMPKEA